MSSVGREGMPVGMQWEICALNQISLFFQSYANIFSYDEMSNLPGLE